MAASDSTAPAAPGVVHRLHLHDGSQREVACFDVEVDFPEGQLIVSRTDLEGVITHANEAFVIMSGWQRHELIGAPHHILRHPDMPRAAFADLWNTIASGRKWHGYVKNLRRDGSFYWVYATVVPNVREGRVVGYTSVRRKPSRTRVAECVGLYARMRQEEVAS